MIYPPQINAALIAVNLDDAISIEIDRFNEDFVDSKNGLKLNIAKDTLIIYENGDIFEGKTEELVGRNLVVVYAITTRSIPAQTTPLLIVILYEKAVAPIYVFTDEEKEEFAAIFAKADIVINGKVLKDAPKPFLNDDGIVMVPLRAIAEAFSELGFPTTPIVWFDDTKTVQIGMLLSCVISKDAYSFARMAPVSLGTPPVIKNDRTYVPIDLFGMMLPGTGAGSIDYHFANGKIMIEMQKPIPVDEPIENEK